MSRVRHEKLTVARLVNKLLASCKTLTFVAFFIKAMHEIYPGVPQFEPI